MSKPMPGMAVIVKPTYACNAACTYCEVHKLGSLFKPMEEETFSLLEKKLDEYFKTKTKEKAQVTFYWLGGEPLMVKDEFYKYVGEVTKKSDLHISHLVQSNLIPLAKKDFTNLKSLLKNYGKSKNGGLHFSTSADPVSDARRLKNGKNYDEEFLKALFRIKKEGAKYSAVYTVHSGSLGNEEKIYFYFKNLGFNAFNINAMCDYQGEFKEEEFDMSPKDYGEFLCKMWDIWEKDNNSIDIIPFVSWKHLKQTGKSDKLRCFNDGRCNASLCAVGPNGDVYTCDRAMQAKQRALGNITKDNFEEMFAKKYHQDRIEYLKENDCKDCKWWQYCKGSCPYESKEEYTNNYGKSFWCESYMMLFEHIGA